MDSEKIIEEKLRLGIEQAGGFATKWVSPGNKGVPDRLIWLPDKRLEIIELKSEGKTLDPLQRVWHKRLLGLGFNPRVFDTLKKLEEFLNEIRST